jgi:RNA recognition motif-containing protein
MQQVARHSNLYVANLPTSIDTEPALRSLFSAYGQIESCRLVRNSRGDGNGSFAFVKFSSINEALAAIAALNNAQIGSSVLEVKVADADAGGPRLSGIVYQQGFQPLLYIQMNPGFFTAMASQVIGTRSCWLRPLTTSTPRTCPARSLRMSCEHCSVLTAR